jgi:hypothetical protein
MTVNAGKSSLTKLPNGRKNQNKKGEAAGSSVKVVLAAVNESNSSVQVFQYACL